MATPDEGIKRVLVSQSELPAVADTGNYYVRYRVISFDGSQTSAWSPKYQIAGKSFGRVTNSKAIDVDVSSNDQSITCVWTVPPEIDGRKFDVWVRWSYETEEDVDEWIYDSTTSDKIANIPIEQSTITRTAAVSSASGSGVVTYLTPSGNGYRKGNLVTVTGMLPTQYNVTSAVITEVTPAYFKVSGVSTPGSSTQAGASTAVSVNEKAKYVQILVQIETVPKVSLPGSELEVVLTEVTKTARILDGGTP
jgi:hypothetical protein